MKLGEYFLKHKVTNEEQIKKALEIQASSGGKIGEILLAMINMRAIDYYKIIAKHYKIDFLDLLKYPVDFSLLDIEKKEQYYDDLIIPVAKQQGQYTVVTADPNLDSFEKIKQIYGENTIIACTSKFDVMWTLQKHFKSNYLDAAIYDLSQKHEKLSAKYVPPLWLRIIYMLPFFALIALFFIDFKWALLVLNCLALVGLTVIVSFKLALSLIGLVLISKDKKKIKEVSITEKELPVYSILIPLYKETHATLDNLFSHIKKLIYPKHKLDIKVLLEEDDIQTIEIIKKMRLPSYIEFIYVPASEPRTKAKACNYGFQFVRGKYLCLYDAEDQPNPDQLVKVAQLFKDSENNKVACVQCKLNFYNSNENWLTRMFTIEYTYWFDLLLPALAVTNIPIPLGGTSNHFRTEILKQVFAWDPFNVTEDADLGLRISRLGYVTKILDSTTYEEANCQLVNWIKQRTRWVKGYMQTYLVHMRNPFELWYKIGTRGFLGFQLFVGGTVLSNLTNIPMWLTSILVLSLPQVDVSYYFPGIMYDIAYWNLAAGTVGIILLNVMGVIARKKYYLILDAITSPAYWLLMSAATYRSLYQLIFNPSYWDKTQHGISSIFTNQSYLTVQEVNINNMALAAGIKFGTSGLRANNELLTDKVCYEFTYAFLQYLESLNKINKNASVMIAGDLRENTDHMLKIIAKAINDKGYAVEFVGKIPTPALAYYSQLHQSPGMMVTGSHIPANMNGIKFYTADGEITKADEKGILSQTIKVPTDMFFEDGKLQDDNLFVLPLNFDAANAFVNRYINFLPKLALQGMKVGIYKHSSVAAELLSEVLQKLGAEVWTFGESTQFYSVDTESLSLSDKQIVAHHLKVDDLDLVISTDGDADRPLLSDEKGNWLSGDMIGLLNAIILSAQYVVTPISSNCSVEKVNLFKKVVRTKIGSPYVIEAMEAIKKQDPYGIIGYEANGGVLIGSEFNVDGRYLSALPTRDSFIAILSILSYVNQNKVKVSDLVSRYSLAFTESTSVKGIAIEKTSELFTMLNQNNQLAENLQSFFHLPAKVIRIDHTDGLRAYLSDDSVVHLRGSGNSPELRCYTEANSKEKAISLNQHVMNIIKAWNDYERCS